MSERTIFLAALEKPTAERPDFLASACAGDAELRRRVEGLLAAHDQAGSFLNRAPTGAYEPAPENAGDQIGPYKLLQKLGEGGMGAVWVAEQTEPVKRRVALKVIKPGMDSARVVARFEAERQALALMDHTNIAKVFDGGATAAGRPYFVMELVKGVPITTYCDELHLTVRERLDLFVQVCAAVQHAHQKGVIHRDLKPSNVLVAVQDGFPVPKVIDFGVAKALHTKLAERTLYTEFGAVIGTLEYMAPEQAELSALDVDTRADVYALGVLLYELLTGSTPLTRERLKSAAFAEVLRIIKEEEPPKPSTRLTASKESLAGLAAKRRTDPGRLAREVRGELDWIVLKSLEKDRTRRYESASALSRDVQRLLADEPVEACPPSAAYRLRKFVRRHRAGVITTAAVVAGSLLAAAGQTWNLLQARAAEARAVAAEQQAVADRTAAEEARQAADANAKEAKQYAGAWSKVSEQFLGVAIDAEIRSLGLKVDLDLAELRTDPRLGLLRLARPMKHTCGPLRLFGPNSEGTMDGNFDGHPPFIELREFVTAAVLATGQNYAPLLPPITHDGHAMVRTSLSPDSQTLLTVGQDFTARLWDTRTARLIAVLRKGNERVVNCGFSPDGRTVFTDDRVSVARLWDVPSGRYRAGTEPRPNRYDDSDHPISAPEGIVQLNGDRLLTLGEYGAGFALGWKGPAELWDSASGRLIARLVRPAADTNGFYFPGGGRWVATVEGPSTVLVFSAEDGRLLARLSHPAEEVMHNVQASPSGRRVATITGSRTGHFRLRTWDTNSWRAEPPTIPLKAPFSQFLTDDLFVNLQAGLGVEEWVHRRGQAEPVALTGHPLLPAMGDLVHLNDGTVFDLRAMQRLLPPPGRKFHPDLARFAPDGRFVEGVINGEAVLIDTRTEKYFRYKGPGFDGPTVGHDWQKLPGFGMVAIINYGSEVRLLPSSDRPNIPPDLLELWAQVAVRGEIGPDGTFVKWDEPTWQRKRQELAARPAPYPDFPFPGRVAADKLHWLRAEFDTSQATAEKLRLAGQLLRRADEIGDRDEAVRWRTELARLVRVPLPW